MLHQWRRDWGALWDRVYAVAGNHDLDSPRGLELWREIVPARRPAPPYSEGLGFASSSARSWCWAWTPPRG